MVQVLSLHAALRGAVSALDRVRAAATASASPSTPSRTIPSMAEALVNARRTASSSTPSQLPLSPQHSSAGVITPPTIPPRPPVTSAAAPNGLSSPQIRLPRRPPTLTPPQQPPAMQSPLPLPGRSQLSPRSSGDGKVSSISPRLQHTAFQLPLPSQDKEPAASGSGHQQIQQQAQQQQQEGMNSAHVALMVRSLITKAYSRDSVLGSRS